METVMEEKVKQKRLHKMHMENRNKLEMTGIVDVISFGAGHSGIRLRHDYD